jgi:hypothetical protein
MIVFSDQVWKRIGTFCRQVRSLEQSSNQSRFDMAKRSRRPAVRPTKGKRGNGAQKLKRNKKK